MNDLIEFSEEEILVLTTFPELAGGLAHEVAQPLNAISLVCEVLRLKIGRLALSETDFKFFEDKLAGIKSQVVRASETVNGIRRYASGSIGSSTNDMETSSLRICNLLRQQFIVRGIEFNLENRIEGSAQAKFDSILLDLIITQCLVFARNKVEFLEKLHRENGSNYAKRIEVFLNSSSNTDSLMIKWDPGTFTTKDSGQSIPTRSEIGMIASKEILSRLGASLQTEHEHISLNFPQNLKLPLFG